MTAVAGLLLVLAPSLAIAQSELPPEIGYLDGELETPRSTAVSGALRATGNSTSALFTNPANMAIAQLYHIGGFAQLSPETARQSYGAAVVDSLVSSSKLAGGLSIAWNLQDPKGIDREWTDLRFGLALPVSESLFLGASGRYMALSQGGVGPLGDSPISGGLRDSLMLHTMTFDLGVTLRPVEQLMIAVTGHNLTGQNNNLLPLMGGVALGYADEQFAVGADALLINDAFSGEATVRAQGGAEVLLADRVSLRGGYRYDQAQQTHSLSGGLGYLDPRFAINAALRRTIAGPEATFITLGFTLHIEALGLGM